MDRMAINNLKLQGFEITGIPMEYDGIDVEQLEAVLEKYVHCR